MSNTKENTKAKYVTQVTGSVDSSHLLTVQETAEYLKCSIPTVYRRIASGELKAYKLGKNTRSKRALRIRREDIDTQLLTPANSYEY